MNIKTQRYFLSLGLAIVNAVGVVLTSVMVSKETVKAKEEFEKLPKNSNRFIKFKTFVKNYKKAIIFGGATIASGIGSKVLSCKIESGLMATATMLGASLNKYKGTVKKTLGIDADKSIVKEIMKDDYKKSNIDPENGEKLYYIENLGYFYARPENVMNAYVMLNRDMSDNDNYSGQYAAGIFTLGEFLTICQGRPLSKNLSETNYNFGWSFDYLSEGWNNVWVHMEIGEPDENGASLIYFYEPPIWNPMEWYDYHYGYLKGEKYFKGANMDKIDLGSYAYETIINENEEESIS
jgi:hypothetical protein